MKQGATHACSGGGDFRHELGSPLFLRRVRHFLFVLAAALKMHGGPAIRVGVAVVQDNSSYLHASALVS